jgi:hypothetical protein
MRLAAIDPARVDRIVHLTRSGDDDRPDDAPAGDA